MMEILDIIYGCKIGDFLSNRVIYQYVYYLHGNRDFIWGSLGDRINKWDKYQLVKIDITKLNTDEYYRFDSLVEEYIIEYERRGIYPPPVVTNDWKLIDGNHRSNALKKLGIWDILVFRGIKNI
jgi:hypothetical protein